MLITRGCSIVPDAHFATTEVGDDKPQGTSWNVETSKDSYDNIVVNTIERFTEVDHACKDSCGVSIWVIQLFVDEVKQQDKVVVN